MADKIYAHEGVDWGNVIMLEHLVAIAAVENNEVILWTLTNGRTVYGVCDRNAGGMGTIRIYGGVPCGA